MRKTLALLGFCLLPLVPAQAQIQPATSAQIQQQGDAAIQKSGDALVRGMTDQQIGQIQQDQRREQLFHPTQPGQPPYPPVAEPPKDVPAR